MARRYVESTVTISPDASAFFYLTSHGDLATDRVIEELTIFAAADVIAAFDKDTGTAPAPLSVVVRPTSGKETVAILNPRWEPDGSISFGGYDEAGIPQNFAIDVRSGRVTQLTHWTGDVHSSLRSGDGSYATIFLAANPQAPGYPVHAVSRQDLIRRFIGTDMVKGPLTSYFAFAGDTPFEIKDTDLFIPLSPWISPDGRWAIAARLNKVRPDEWGAYDRLQSPLGTSARLRYVLVDLKRRLERNVFDAPTGLAVEAGAKALGDGVFPAVLWASDNRHAVLVNTSLPDPRTNPKAAAMAFIVGFDVETGRWEEIEPLQSKTSEKMDRRVISVTVRDQGRELLISHAQGTDPAPSTSYTLRDGHWVGHEVATPTESDDELQLPRGLRVLIEQGANEPPHVVGILGNKRLDLSTNDPALAQVWLTPAEEFQWQLPGGSTMTGGLLRPKDTKGPVPLVIQAYEFDPAEFKPDGPFRHVYAGQSLAAERMAVLTITIPWSDKKPFPGVGKEAERIAFMERIESAADALTKKGIIDRARVGLIGFSRGGYLAYHAITHPRTLPLAAALIDDAHSGSFTDYLLDNAMTGGQAGEDAGGYGGNFWEAKSEWLRQEPLFNVDQIRTPALFTVHGEQNVMRAFAEMASFGICQRPMDYYSFPEAKHELRLPQQRFASMELSVEWMAFWLKGEIPKDPDRAARWAILRKQQDEILKTPPPPKGKWVFVEEPKSSTEQTKQGPEPAAAGK